MNIRALPIKKIILIIASLLLLTIFAPEIAQAQSASDAVCDTIGAVDPDGSCAGGGGSISGIIETVLNILSFVAGFVAVVMIIVAGLKFITSRGDSGAVSSARNTALYAIIGIVIVLFSQIIVRFVITESTTINNTSGDSGFIVQKMAS